MTSFRKLLCTATAAMLLSASFAACAARTVTDDNGDKVELPDTVNRAVVTNILPLASAVTVFTGNAKTVVGMHPVSWSAAKAGLLGRLYPDVLSADHSFMKGALLNVEALTALSPDVVFVNAGDKKTLETVRNAGLAAFAISPTKWHYDVIETHAQWMKSLAKVWPELAGKGELIEARSREIAARVLDRVKDVPDARRPKVLFLYRADSTGLVTSGKRFFGQYWAQAVGAKNAAESVESDNANAVISMEQIYAWNPDVILITNFTTAVPDDIYKNANGRDWTAVKAAASHRVHKMPLGIYRSYTPSADTPLTLLWLAKTVWPERFSDIDLEHEVKTYYHDLYGVDLTDADVAQLFHPDSLAGVGAAAPVRAK